MSTDLSPRGRGRCEDTCGFRGARDGVGGKSVIWDTQKYSVLAPTAREMNKIVSFGLGDLSDDEHAKFERCLDDRRNRNQHEAVLTMARVLKERLVGKFADTCKPQSKHKTPSNLSRAAIIVAIDDSGV